MLRKRDGTCVLVRQNGKLLGSYDLDEDQEIDIGSGNHISIESGSVRMTSADCPDQICIRQGKISTEGAMITCLPNRVTVQVMGDDAAGETGLDAIAY